MVDKNTSISDKNSKDFLSAAGYSEWRAKKLQQASELAKETLIIPIEDIANLKPNESEEICNRCDISNAVLYRDMAHETAPERISSRLRQFADSLGLRIAEKHRSAGNDGIVSLQESESAGKKGYIPYSKRPINWHTDGYYNGPDQKIRAMVLHCARAAESGGKNQLLDPEIAYIRLRDANPDYITALSHPQAMTIPENDEGNGKIRPVSIGPVFAIDPQTGKLEMRYTARTRSIAWREDAITAEAVAFLTELLASDEPFIQTIHMQSGVGVLCNNSLHNRTGFDANMTKPSERLMMRVRFHNRVQGK
ncbi:MAG: TauD/TfdA family dioxygenase [Rhodobacteraceae bacterium]|nr:TauD/TfdA family dioxygenase [Paracoccaceae bacterium]